MRVFLHHSCACARYKRPYIQTAVQQKSRSFSMAKYVKQSIATGAVAVSFLLGFPATEVATKLLARLWTLYGAYIRMWLEQHAAFFVVLCFLCVAVVLLYGIILLPFLQPKKPYKIDEGEPRTQCARTQFHRKLGCDS